MRTRRQYLVMALAGREIVVTSDRQDRVVTLDFIISTLREAAEGPVARLDDAAVGELMAALLRARQDLDSTDD